ncbi:hypothetical protein B7494_g5213 [Chlorociboria aeruginascens]|nr:hypothetical protein B7494_g5213 [Chlorociboria aeruginascens]
MASAEIKGSCNCGAIKYTTTGPALKKVLCQCAVCRKQTGTLFSSYTQFKETVSNTSRISNMQLLHSVKSPHLPWQHQVTKVQDITILDPTSTLKTWRDFDPMSETKFSRSFCSSCGSALFAGNETLFPGFLGVSVGTSNTENQESWAPDMEICRGSSTAWLLDGLDKAEWTAFPKYPPPA